MARVKASTVAEYIKAAPTEAQPRLKEIRAILKEIAPKAVETIKWGAPIYEENRILFSFSAHKTHLNFMPTRRTLDLFREEVKDYKTGRDTIQFPYDKPVPKSLVKKIARHRAKDVRENDSRWM
jgi:uncharacterized protein YdhG (YjbR/CyaY superfamily)